MTQDVDAAAAPLTEEAPKQAVHPRARRISISKAQPPAEVQHPSLNFNTNHVFEVNNGQASVCVNDTLEMRAAFLKYCNSSMRPTEMHRMAGPFMTAPNFMSMCKDLELAEPQGPLSPMVIGFCYATLKSDDAEGLTYASFLDALMELAFEAGRNVAGQLQAIYAAKPVPPPRPPSLMRADSSCRVRTSEPGFAPQAPLQPRMSESGNLVAAAAAAAAACPSPARDRTLQPRFSETGRFQRSSSMFRSLPSPLETPSSILGGSASTGAISPRAALEEELRSSSANGVAGEAPKCPRPPSALMRTSISGGSISRPTFRPSVGQRPLKARGALAQPLLLDLADGADPAPDDAVPAHHPLHGFAMNSWAGSGDAPMSPPPQLPLPSPAPSSVRSSPLSRISAKFQVSDSSAGDDEEPDALFPSPKPQSTGSLHGRPPSASCASPVGRLSISGRPPSASSPSPLSRGQSRPPSASTTLLQS